MFARQRRESPRIELSSLVDVVFLLLIFFMVTTRFANEPAVDIQLPSAEGEPKQVDEQLSELLIDSEQRIYLDGEEVDREALSEQIAARFGGAAGSTRSVVLRGDENANWGTVTLVFDALSKNDVEAITAPTRPPGDSR